MHVLFANIKILIKLIKNEHFCNICDWFEDNKLGENKTKSIINVLNLKVKI